jgi:hypothetical protein
MTRYRRLASPALSLAVAIALGLSACSGSGEDVRITLCKDMVAVRLAGEPIDWVSVETRTRGYEPAVVRLRFSATDTAGSARCWYDHNAVEDTAMALSDPLSSYSASPSKMILNGETLSPAQLADTIRQAMLKQGRSALSGAAKLVQ